MIKGLWLSRLRELSQSGTPLSSEELEDALQCAKYVRAERDEMRTEARLRWRNYGTQLQATEDAVSEVDAIINEFITWALRNGVTSPTFDLVMSE